MLGNGLSDVFGSLVKADIRSFFYRSSLLLPPRRGVMMGFIPWAEVLSTFSTRQSRDSPTPQSLPLWGVPRAFLRTLNSCVFQSPKRQFEPPAPRYPLPSSFSRSLRGGEGICFRFFCGTLPYVSVHFDDLRAGAGLPFRFFPSFPFSFPLIFFLSHKGINDCPCVLFPPCGLQPGILMAPFLLQRSLLHRF